MPRLALGRSGFASAASLEPSPAFAAQVAEEWQKAFPDATKIGKPALPVLRKALAVERSCVPAACALMCVGPETSEAGGDVIAAHLSVKETTDEDMRFVRLLKWAVFYDIANKPDKELKALRGVILAPAPSKVPVFKSVERLERGTRKLSMFWISRPIGFFP